MFLLSYMFIAVVIIYIGLGIYIYKLSKKRFSDKKYLPKLVIAFFILLPTYDIFITYILSGYHCSTTPKTFINKTVEYPQSIYWEDNVYPGFNAEDRKLMIKNYLDGVHLKTMALNGDDGKVYIYSCEKDIKIYKKSLQEKKIEENKLAKVSKEYSILLKQRRDIIKTKKILTKEDVDKLPQEDIDKLLYLYGIWMGGNFQTWHRYVVNTPDIKKLTTAIKNLNKDKTKIKSESIEYFKDFTNQCIQNEKIYTKATMPKLNYIVTFNEVKLNFFSRNFLYSDVTEITNNTNNEVVAQNHRIMKLLYNITPRLRQIYYIPEPMCGESHLYYDGKGFNYIGYYGSAKHTVGLNNYLYKKYIKGEK